MKEFSVTKFQIVSSLIMLGCWIGNIAIYSTNWIKVYYTWWYSRASWLLLGMTPKMWVAIEPIIVTVVTAIGLAYITHICNVMRRN